LQAGGHRFEPGTLHRTDPIRSQTLARSGSGSLPWCSLLDRVGALRGVEAYHVGQVDDELASVELRVGVGASSDDEELAELTARLRRQLLDLEVTGVDRPSTGDAPTGAKGVDPIALGTLVVTLARRAGVLTSLTKTVQRWLAGRGDRTVRLELDGDSIELTGASARDQERLVELWIARHATEP
jgi:hypothetical protein